MRMMALALLATLAATAVRGEETLEGQWIAISVEENGASAGDRVGERMTFEGTGFRIVDIAGNLVSSGTFATDASATPAEIDFSVKDGAAAGTTWHGIWKRDGTMLTVVDNAPDPARPRPDSFAAPVGSGYAMLVLTPWE